MENQENLGIDQNKKKDYLLPLSIIIAALLISGSWIYTTGLKNVEPEKQIKQPAVSESNLENVKPISNDDYIRSNPNAPVKIIEFSDLECPFCKLFHGTMKRIVDEYDGRVVWVYRHWPLEQLHSKAKTSALAAECAGGLGGNDKFWQYLDKYFEATPSNNQIDLSELPNFAESIGLNRSQFENCLQSGKYASKIDNQIQDAVNSNPECPRCGTPFSVVIGRNGKKYPIPGAYPYEDVKAIIEELLK
ncbi:MAG: DsbA family protein [Patescibacteria group bacterium]